MSIKVEFVTPDKESFVVEGEVGQNLRDLAVDNMVPGLIGECGGTCACGTCHVHVDPGWIDKVGKVEDGGLEEGLLYMFESNGETSRLGCQVELTEEMDGLKVEVVVEEI